MVSLVALTAALAGLLFGFDTAVISGVTQDLRHVFALDSTALGFVVSAALWGTLAGALLAGPPGDRFGRRTCLFAVAVIYGLGAACSALAQGAAGFAAGRFAVGLAIGASSVLAPVYIAETAPAARRGALVGSFQLAIVLGIMLAYVSNLAWEAALAVPWLWRLKLGIAVLPALLFFVLLRLAPESPRWLAAQGRMEAAAHAARRVGLQTQDWCAAARLSAAPSKPRLFTAAHAKPVCLAIAIAVFNQLSGINAVLYYLNDIFAYAGFSRESASLQAIAVGLANLLATLAAMQVIDRWGRRPLLLIGSAGMAGALAGIALVMQRNTAQALLLPLLLCFIACFAFSQGAVIWVYLSEIFPQSIRARGQGLGGATHWGCNALIGWVFPIIASRSRALPFAVFAAAMIVQCIVVAVIFPETKGRELEAEGAAAAPAYAD